MLTTLLAFLLAYTIHYTNIPKGYKGLICKAAVVPMLLPTITYGFAIIYSFGKQGLITQLLGKQLFEIYGFNGLLLGYVIYTLPISFLLVSNTMEYIDKKFTIVSRIMGDKPLTTFAATVVRPLLGTLAASFVQCFFLCFTDYGIPASVGGEYDVVATVLYNEMLGSIPNFNTGSAVAMLMLIPSIVTIALLHYLEKYNIRYNKISNIEIRKNVVRAFAQALKEMEEEGGIPARNKRYTENNHLLTSRLRALGFETYVGDEYQGPIITTFFYPADRNYTFQEMYQYIKERGYAIYPGKVTDAETFRIGNIGEIYPEDINRVCDIIEEFLHIKRAAA